MMRVSAWAQVWRFSHARHHTDTDIVGRDPEIDGRPLDMWNLFIAFFNVQGIQGEATKLWRHARGQLYVPLVAVPLVTMPLVTMPLVTMPPVTQLPRMRAAVRTLGPEIFRLSKPPFPLCEVVPLPMCILPSNQESISRPTSPSSVHRQTQRATLIYLLGCQISLPEVFWHPIIFVKIPKQKLEELGTKKPLIN